MNYCISGGRRYPSRAYRSPPAIFCHFEPVHGQVITEIILRLLAEYTADVVGVIMQPGSTLLQRQILVILMLDDVDQLLGDIMILGVLPAVEDDDDRLNHNGPEPVFDLGHDMQIGQAPRTGNRSRGRSDSA